MCLSSMWQQAHRIQTVGLLGLLAVNGLGINSFAQESIAARIPALQTAYVGFEVGENEVEFTPGRLVAVVGEEHVLAGEVLSLFETKLMEMAANAPEKQVQALRNRFFRQALTEVIKMKMMSQQFYVLQAKNKPVSDRDEVKQQVRLAINRAFYESYVPILLKQYKASTEVELDQILRTKNTSLEGQKLTFLDSVLADEYRKMAVPQKFKIDVLEVRDRYEQDMEKWQRPARARFQKMSVCFESFLTKTRPIKRSTACSVKCSPVEQPLRASRSEGPRVPMQKKADTSTGPIKECCVASQ